MFVGYRNNTNVCFTLFYLCVVNLSAHLWLIVASPIQDNLLMQELLKDHFMNMCISSGSFFQWETAYNSCTSPLNDDGTLLSNYSLSLFLIFISLS